jgi:hypothetical protein
MQKLLPGYLQLGDCDVANAHIVVQTCDSFWTVRRSSDPLEKIFIENKNKTESNGIKVVAVLEFRQNRLSYYLDMHYNWQQGY